jgi:hypothetical protein
VTREEIQLIRAHIVSLIKERGPLVQIPVKAGTMLAMLDMILALPASSKGRS